MPPAKDETVGKYKIGDSIGKGGFGVVYKGLDTETGGFVAIKQVDIKNVPKDELESIEMEIALLRKLRHAQIVRYVGQERTKENLYIVMEFVENGSLQAVVKKFGCLKEELISVYIGQVLQGLIYLHEQGVIHRDIKGANILTTKEGHVKLADFGIATKLEDAGSEEVVGTPYWMAPEIVEMLPSSPASDIWSVGCTVVELLTSVPPYFDLAPMSALYRIVSDDHPPLPDKISPALRDFLMQCFQKQPDRRVTAAALLKHPWIAKSQRKKKAPSSEERRSSIPKKSKLAAYAEGENEDWDVDDIDLDMGDVDEVPDIDTPKKDPAKLSKPTTGSNLNRFQEDENDEDFGDLMGDEGDVFEKMAEDEEISVDESDLRSKLTKLQQRVYDDGSSEVQWDDFDEGDFDDDKADLENANIVVSLAQKLQIEGSNEESVKQVCEELVKHFEENPQLRQHLVTHHGVVPIMELLETHSQNVLVTQAILTLVNKFTEDNFNTLENLCNLGAIPVITAYAKKEYSSEIRVQAAQFLNKICSASTTLQMFIAARGLPILADLLATEYTDDTKHMVWDTIRNVNYVFELQTPTPKNDFCRLFVRGGLLDGLADALVNVYNDSEEEAEKYSGMCATLFMIFSNSDPIVKKAICTPKLIKAMLSVLSLDRRKFLLKMLRSLKFISMDKENASTVLIEAGMLRILIPFLGVRDGEVYSEINNQVLNTIYNIVHLTASNGEESAKNGIVPHLQYFIEENTTLRQFAVPMYIDVVRASRIARDKLWDHDGVKFLVGLLNLQEYWQAQVLESIAVWVADDARRVEQVLQKPENIEILVNVFSKAKDDTIPGFMESYLKILSVSVSVNRAICRAGFVSHLLNRIGHPEAKVRIGLLKILMILYEFSQKPKKLIHEYDLFPLVTKLKETDSSVIVQSLAENLLTAFGANRLV